MQQLAEYKWNGETEWALVDHIAYDVYRIARHINPDRVGKYIDSGHYTTVIEESA
jgi:hypothetical protein